MGRTKFTEGQITDEDLITNDEIGAGYKDLETGPAGTWPVTTSSVNTSTNTITVSGIDFTQLGIEPEDVVALTGGPNAGDYTVLQVTSATELQVNENLSSASGGDSLTVYHQPGSKRVGVNDTAFTKIVGGDLQGALESVDGQLLTGETAGGDLSGTYPNPEVNDLTITGETTGDTLYYNGTNWVRLAVGTANQYLNGGTNPSWQQISTSELNNDANFVDNTHTHTSADVTDFNEAAQDAVGTILTDTTTIDFTYDDTANSVSATVIQSAINTASLNNDAGFISGITAEPIGDLSDVTITTGAGNLSDNDILAYDFGTGEWINQTASEAGLASSSHTHTSADITDFDEASQDSVGGILTDTTTIDFTYNDAGNTISASVIQSAINTASLNNDAGFISGITAEPIGDLSDVTITSAGDNEVLAYNSGTSEWINQTPAEAGLASASHTHTSADVTDFNEAAQDAVGTILTDTSSIDFTYNDAGNTISATVIEGGVNTSGLNNDAGFIDGVEISVDGAAAVGTKPSLDFVAGNNISIGATLSASNIELEISSKYDSGAAFPTSPDDRQYFLYTDVTDQVVSEVVNNTAGIGVLMHYDTGTSTWKMPGTIPAGDAGGDLSGNYPQPSVINLSGLTYLGASQGVGSVAFHSGTATEWYATEGGLVNDGDILYWDNTSTPPRPYWDAPSAHTHNHSINHFEAYNNTGQSIASAAILETTTVRSSSGSGFFQLSANGVYESQISGLVAIDMQASFQPNNLTTTFEAYLRLNGTLITGSRIYHSINDPSGGEYQEWYGSITWKRTVVSVSANDTIDAVIEIIDHGGITTVTESVSVMITPLFVENTTP